MDGETLARVGYLAIILVALGGWVMVEFRQRMGQALRMALAWGLIFLGVVAGYGLWNDVRDDVLVRQSVEADTGEISVPRGPDGHFHLRLELNETPVTFLVDTGASDIVLTMRDAERIGVNTDDLAFIGVARTANGTVRTAYTTVEKLALGSVTFRDVSVAVNEGEMDGSLLGMAYLNRFSRLEIASDTLRLVP